MYSVERIFGSGSSENQKLFSGGITLNVNGLAIAHHFIDLQLLIINN